jgi:mono/diheme cytochrome c family protein
MRRPLAITALLLAAALLSSWAVGCGSAQKEEIPVTRYRDDPQLSRGRVVFMHTCNQCHVGGGPGLGPGINDKPLPAAAIKLQVREGLGTMPSFPKEEISDTDLDAVVKYLLVLREQGSPTARR